MEIQRNLEILEIEIQELHKLKEEIKSAHKPEKEKKQKEKADKSKENLQKLIKEQEKPIINWNTKKPEISITFDDGYGQENITTILEKLKKSWVKATFFVLWECIRKSKELWKQAIEDGHQICCHTYSHAYLYEETDKKENTKKTTTELFKGHGIKPKNRKWLIASREINVKRLLGQEYYNTIKKKNPKAPEIIDSATLLETEILMREKEVKLALGEKYLVKMKQNHPFFRFPGGCWATRKENIEVLKKYGYLSIGRNGEPVKDKEKDKQISNWDIILFHFNQENIKILDPYLSKIKESWKTSKVISEIIAPET